MGQLTQSEAAKMGVKISLYSIIFSVLLSFLKLLTGFLGSSSALVSDGFNSLGDIISYTAVAGGVAASERKADSNHNYGHEKLESIVSVFIALAILITGLAIGYSGVVKIADYKSLAIPTLLPIIGAIISIGVKVVLWLVSRDGAKKSGLNSLRALATDHFSDMLSSTGALVGIIGSRLGLPVLDPIASVVIALLIIKSAIEVFIASFGVLMDVSVDNKTKEELKKAILKDKRIQRIDLLKTRSVGSGYWVDLEICCCKSLQLQEAHDIAQEVHDNIERDFPKVRHVMVHVNPCSGEEEFCPTCAQKSELIEKDGK